MASDNIAAAAEHFYDSRQEVAERQADADEREAERLAVIAERERNHALNVIRAQLVGDVAAAKAFAMQLLATISSTIFDHYTDGPMDKIHEAIFGAVEQLEAQGVTA